MIQNQFLPYYGFTPLIFPALIDDRDLFINNTISNLTTSEPGPQGPPGPPGPSGQVQPLPGRVITQSSTITNSDVYIGAKLESEAELTLPENPVEYTQLVIKLEYGAPIGNRKLKVKSNGQHLINGVNSFTLTTPYQVLRLIYSNNAWYTI